MKKLFLSLSAAAVLLLPISTHAAEKTGFYIAPKFVLNIQHTKSDLNARINGQRSQYYNSFVKNTSNTLAGGALAIGYDFSRKFDMPLRTELEYTVNSPFSEKNFNKISDLQCDYEIGIQTLLLNVYGDLFTWNGFTPYVGAGIGIAFIKTKYDNYSHMTAGRHSATHSSRHTQKALAGQVGLGCSYAFNETVSVDLGYRFMLTGNGESADKKLSPYTYKLTNKEIRIHQFMLGMRVTF